MSALEMNELSQRKNNAPSSIENIFKEGDRKIYQRYTAAADDGGGGGDVPEAHYSINVRTGKEPYFPRQLCVYVCVCGVFLG